MPHEIPDAHYHVKDLNVDYLLEYFDHPYAVRCGGVWHLVDSLTKKTTVCGRTFTVKCFIWQVGNSNKDSTRPCCEECLTTIEF